MLSHQDQAKSLVAPTPAAPKEKLAALKKMGIEVLTIRPDNDGRVDLKHLLKALGERDVSSLLVEGGGAVITSFFKTGLWDKVVVFIAPKILGKSTDSVGDLNITDLAKALPLSFTRVYRSGADIVIEARPESA